MGVELLWKHAKAVYRARLGQIKVNGEEYDNLEVVQEILEAVTHKQAKDWAG